MPDTEAALEAAIEALYLAQKAKRDAESERIALVRRALDREFDAAIYAADKVVREAQAAHDAYLVETAVERLSYPMGTVFWELERSWMDGKMFLTGRKAVVEVFTGGDAFLGDAPSPGDPILRVLTKDGEVGKDTVWRRA